MNGWSGACPSASPPVLATQRRKRHVSHKRRTLSLYGTLLPRHAASDVLEVSALHSADVLASAYLSAARQITIVLNVPSRDASLRCLLGLAQRVSQRDALLCCTMTIQCMYIVHTLFCWVLAGSLLGSDAPLLEWQGAEWRAGRSNDGRVPLRY